MEQKSDVNLKWDAHQTTLKSVFDNLLDNKSLADCTVGAEGQHLKAHKLILSACSHYFEVLFSHHRGKDIIIILPGVKFHILKALIVFIYRGEVVIPQDEIDGLLQLAEFLQVKGLSYGDNVVSEKKNKNKMRNKSPTLHFSVAPESHKQCDSPELLDVSGSNSQTESLQDYTKVTHISMPVCKRKKSDWHSSEGEPQLKRNFVTPSQTVSQNFPLQKSEMPDKSKSAHDMSSDPSSRPPLATQLAVYSEKNFSELTLSRGELISTKTLNSVVRTALSSTVSEENTCVEIFADPKLETCSGLNQDYVPDEMIDSDDTQQQNVIDENTFDMSVLTENSFCDGKSFSRQTQLRQAERTKFDTAEKTSSANNRFKCQSCDRSYCYYKGLIRHLKYECGKEPQFQCPHCPARFVHKHSMQTHMFRHNY